MRIVTSFLVGVLVAIATQVSIRFALDPLQKLHEDLVDTARTLAMHGSVFTTTRDDLRPELEEAARKSVEERSAVLLARVNSVHHGWKVAAWFGLPPRADLLKAARELRGLGKSSQPSHWPGISEKAYRQRIELYEEVTEGRIKRIQKLIRISIADESSHESDGS